VAVRASSAFVVSVLLISGLLLASDGQASAQAGPPAPPPASSQRMPESPSGNGARENVLIQETKAIDGHVKVSTDEIVKDRNSSTKDKFRKLHQERLWAVNELDQQRRELDDLHDRPVRDPIPVPVKTDAAYDAQIQRVDQEIKKYEAQQNNGDLKESERAEAKAQLLDLTRQKARATFELMTYRQFQNDSSKYGAWEQRQKTANTIIEQTRPYLSAIDATIGELMLSSSDEGQFRLQMGIGFLILVSLLIVFFFFFASRSGSMREIMRDDRGLQFITLFSLVIAITLFGLLNILEGKELAALLGGLSGYILGRSNLGGGHPDRHPEAPTRGGGTPAQTASA